MSLNAKHHGSINLHYIIYFSFLNWPPCNIILQHQFIIYIICTNIRDIITVLYFSVMCCVALCYAVLYCNALYALHYSIFIVFYCVVLCSVVLC